MDLDKKAEEILEETYNEHKHRMSDWVHNSTKDMVIDAIKKALTIHVVSNCEHANFTVKTIKNKGTFVTCNDCGMGL